MSKKGKYLTNKRAKGYFSQPWPKEGEPNWYFRTGLMMGWQFCNENWLKNNK